MEDLPGMSICDVMVNHFSWIESLVFTDFNIRQSRLGIAAVTLLNES